MQKALGCVLCGKQEEIEHSDKMFSTKVIQCTEYKIIYFIDNGLHEDYKIRASLRYYLTNNKTKNDKPYLVTKTSIDNEDYNIISVDELLNIFPKTLSDRIDKILLNLANLASGIGSVIEIFKNEIYVSKFSAIFFIENDDKYEERLFSIIAMMEEMGYIRIVNSVYRALKIDYSGWERIDRIQADNRIYNKGFIAMWYDKSMIEYRQAIIDAISESGYVHSIIDEKEYNGQIVPEIFYEIETSNFVVADLTGNRGGVYYEAGYALALGKVLIVTVKDININDNNLSEQEILKYTPHFDVAQRNQIRYKDAEDLKAKLIRRITATVGDHGIREE